MVALESLCLFVVEHGFDLTNTHIVRKVGICDWQGNQSFLGKYLPTDSDRLLSETDNELANDKFQICGLGLR